MAQIFGLGGHASKTDRSHQLQGWGDLQSVFDQSKGTSVDEQVAGNKQYNQGTFSLNQAKNYWQALASGNPSQMSKVLAPQITILKQQTAQRVGTTNQFAGRSGGTAAATIEMGSEAQRAIQNLFDILGPEAMSEFARVSGAQAGLGLSEQSLAAHNLGIAGGAAGTLSGQAGQARVGDIQNEGEMGAAAAQAILTLAGL